MIFANVIFVSKCVVALFITLVTLKLVGEKFTWISSARNIFSILVTFSHEASSYSYEVEMMALFLFGVREVEKKQSFKL